MPKDTEVDGASIPRAFWSAFGPPFVGDYRRASVVHDHYCVTKDKPWKAVHRMFHEGCLAGGVPKGKAKLMYLAVRNFGPRWATTGGLIAMSDGTSLPTGSLLEITPELSEDDFQDLLKWVEEQ